MLCQVMFLSKAKSLHSVHCIFELFFWHFTLMNRFNITFQIMFLSKGNIITKFILEFFLLYFAVMNCSNVSVYNLFRGISFGTIKWNVNVLLMIFRRLMQYKNRVLDLKKNIYCSCHISWTFFLLFPS